MSSSNPQDVVAHLLSQRPNDSFLAQHSESSFKPIQETNTSLVRSMQEQDYSEEDATTRTDLVSESLIVSSALPALHPLSSSSIQPRSSHIMKDTPPFLDSFKELELSELDLHLSSLLTGPPISSTVSSKNKNESLIPSQSKIDRSTSYSLVSAIHHENQEEPESRQKLQKDTSTRERQDLRIQAKNLRETLKASSNNPKKSASPAKAAPAPIVEKRREDQSIQTEDTKEKEVVEKSLTVILQMRKDRDKFKAMYEQEKLNNTQLQSTLGELKVATSTLEKKFTDASSLLARTQESEEIFKAQAHELSIQVAQHSSKVLRLTGQLESTALTKTHWIKKHRAAMLLFFSPEELDKLELEDYNLTECIKEERQAFKADKINWEDERKDLLRQLEGSSQKIAQLQSVIANHEDPKLIKEQLFKEKENYRHECLHVKDLENQLKHIQEDLSTTKQKWITEKREVARLLEKLESQKLDKQTMEIMAVDYQTLSTQHQEIKSKYEQKLKGLGSQISLKDNLLKEYTKKLTQLQDKLNASQFKENQLQDAQSLVQQLKLDLGRKEGMTHHWREKFEIKEKEFKKLQSEVESLKEQKLSFQRINKSLQKKDEMAEQELEHFREMESRYQQLVSALYSLLGLSLSDQDGRPIDSQQESENQAQLIQRMQSISKKYLGLDLQTLLDKGRDRDPRDQLDDILSRPQFEHDLLLFLKQFTSSL